MKKSLNETKYETNLDFFPHSIVFFQKIFNYFEEFNKHLDFAKNIDFTASWRDFLKRNWESEDDCGWDMLMTTTNYYTTWELREKLDAATTLYNAAGGGVDTYETKEVL